MAMSLESPTTMTKLDAVNFMLRAIGETEVNSLLPTSKPTALDAAKELAVANTVVQSQAFSFSRRTEVLLVPNVDNEIVLPEGLLSMSPVGKDQNLDVSPAGGRLLDRGRNTFKWYQTVTIEAVLGMDFEDLPQAAKWYITLLAAVAFFNSKRPADPAIRIPDRILSDAKAQMERADRALRRGGLRARNPFFRKMRGNR